MNNEIIIPSVCPCCESSLEEVNGQLFCRNADCSAKVSKTIAHFAKVLKIKGLGEKTIEKLDLNSVNEIYTTPPSVYKDILGDATATKIIEFIKQSRNADLEELLPALAIPSFGTVAAQKLCKVLHYLPDLTIEKCKEAGLGNVVTEKLMLWWEVNKDDVMQLPFSFRTKKKESSTAKLEQAVVVCITGLLNDYKNRTEAQTYLKGLGFEVVDNLTAKVNVLVKEDDRESTKKDKALKLNIPILTIKQLIERYIKV
jgi:DNA ligase (NAD+)